MADLKLVGAVAIKVRPDASDFKQETQKQIKKELAGVKAEVKVEAKLDTTGVEADAKKLEKEVSGKKITWNVKLDHDSVRAAQKQLDSMLAPTQQIKINLEDDESIAQAIADLEEMAEKAQVKITYAQDQKGYESVLAKIAAIRREKLEIPIEFGTSDEELDRVEKEMLDLIAKLGGNVEVELDVTKTVDIKYQEDRPGLEAAMRQIDAELKKLDTVVLTVELDREKLEAARAEFKAAFDALPVTFKYDQNHKGLEKAIATIDAQIALIKQAEIKSKLDIPSLMEARAKLEAEMSELTVRFEYDESLASLTAVKAKIEALLHIEKLAIVTKLDEASLREALAKTDALIAAHNAANIKPKVEPKTNPVDFLKVATALKLLTKSQTVDIFVKLNNASLFLAAGKLTGLRAASRWTEGFAKSLGSLDRNLPILAAVVVGVNSLTSGFFSLTASAFSLGNELGTVVRMAALLAPAMILGFAAVKTVMTGVFKDFGAAVNGDDKAIEKLTESGKKAAANMRVIFQDIRETVSKNFWAEAGDSMLRFTEVALPSVRDGMAKLSTSMGGVFASIVEATSKFAEEDGFLVFFTNLVRGFDKVRDGMAPFMSAFLNLAALGSTVFPRMGAAFDVMSQKFDAWVKGLALDGSFSRWVDMGVQGIKDLWSAGMSLIGVWKNIGQAAQGAGALTLSSFAAMMAKLDEVTGGFRFQTNLSRIFRGAREASDDFHKALGNLDNAMDNFSITMGNALGNSGKALSAFIDVLGDVLSSSNLDKGLTAFLTGVKRMFEELRPAAGPITEIFRTLGEVLGAVATDSGPLFRTLFQQLATVFTTAWHALEPFLPALIQVGTTILEVLGPALTSVANTLIPAFAAGLVDLGDGLVPVIQFLADFAVNVANMVSDVPLPVIAGIVGGILALNGALQFSIMILPVAKVAMEAFGIMAGITAARMQLMIPVIGIVLAALTGLAIGGVAALATEQSSGTPFANAYATALREDAAAAGEFGTAIGTATTKLAIQNLMTEGTYEAAKKLGVGFGEVTTAVLKGGPAMDTLKAKLDAAEKGFNDTYEASKKSKTFGADFAKNLSTRDAGIEQINKIRAALDGNRLSIEQAIHVEQILAEVNKESGIETEKHAEKVDYLTEALKKQKSHVGAAAQATSVLTDAFSSSAAKVDAMRKTFAILVGPSAKQAAAETLGAYAKGFNDLKETVTPLAQDMRNLGDAVYGEEGFLNVAGGNKAVMQVNQALVTQVDNVWAGAKAAYDAAIKQGKTAQGAFEDSQKFIEEHKGDYNALAEASGVSADLVQGQWDAVFGHEWVLKVTLSGASEAATRAQELVTALGGSFDGKEFVAYLDANPDAAMEAIADPTKAAFDYVNHTWKAKLEAAPESAQESLRLLTGQTEEEWDKGDFKTLLKVADEIPGLQEAILAIRNGAEQDYNAIIYAAANQVSVEEARRILDGLAIPRTSTLSVNVLYNDLKRDQAAENRVQAGRYGGIIDGLGRGMHGFGLEQVKAYANGGIERHVAQIASGRGPVRIWGEKETQGEAYIPYASSKRPRSLNILSQVAKDFGYQLTKATEYSSGGTVGKASPSTTNSASVHIGNLYTQDADEAVRKIRISQQDALAVAGISLNGA